VAKTRVSELAKKYGIPSKEALEKLSAIGEFAKTASSSVELPAVKKFEATYGAELLAKMQPSGDAGAAAPAKPSPRPAPARKPAEAPAPVEAPAAAEAGCSRSAGTGGPRCPGRPGGPGGPGGRGSGRRQAGRPEAADAQGSGPRAAARRQARWHPASGQQPVRPQPGHGPSSRRTAA
jgi:translation initiation factor IF-2